MHFLRPLTGPLLKQKRQTRLECLIWIKGEALDKAVTSE
jgi:hypothetical protein